MAYLRYRIQMFFKDARNIKVYLERSQASKGGWDITTFIRKTDIELVGENQLKTANFQQLGITT